MSYVYYGFSFHHCQRYTGYMDSPTEYRWPLQQENRGFEPPAVSYVFVPNDTIPKNIRTGYRIKDVKESEYYSIYSPDIYRTIDPDNFASFQRQLPGDLASAVGQEELIITSVSGRSFYKRNSDPDGYMYIQYKGGSAHVSPHNTLTELVFPDSVNGTQLSAGVNELVDVYFDDLSGRSLQSYDPRFRGRKLRFAAPLESLTCRVNTELFTSAQQVATMLDLPHDTIRTSEFIDIPTQKLQDNGLISPDDIPTESAWEIRSAHRLEEIPDISTPDMLKAWVEEMSHERIHDDDDVFVHVARYWESTHDDTRAAKMYLSRLGFLIGLDVGIIQSSGGTHNSPSPNQVTWAGEIVDFESTPLVTPDSYIYAFKMIMGNVARQFSILNSDDELEKMVVSQYELGVKAASDLTITDTNSLNYLIEN